MKVTGKITKISEVQTGTSKAGKEWKKLTFVLETTEDYNNVYPFTIFGEEKVDNFVKFNKVDQQVDVDFNISAREWEGKYFVDLQAWKIFKAEESAPVEEPVTDDLPF